MIVPSPSTHTHKYISLGRGKITIAMSILFSTHLGIKGRPKFHSFFTVCFDPLRPLIQGAPMGLLIKKSYSTSSKNHLIISRASTVRVIVQEAPVVCIPVWSLDLYMLACIFITCICAYLISLHMFI